MEIWHIGGWDWKIYQIQSDTDAGFQTFISPDSDTQYLYGNYFQTSWSSFDIYFTNNLIKHLLCLCQWSEVADLILQL